MGFPCFVAKLYNSCTCNQSVYFVLLATCRTHWFYFALATMYGSLITDDTYKRADGIFKSMVEVFNPNLKEYISHGKAYERTLVEEAKCTKASQSAAVKIGISATLSPGCKDVGKCIMEITDSMQEVSMAEDAWMKKFGNDVLYSMEQRYEQDGKYITNLRKKYQDEFKGKTNEVEKAVAAVAKLKKRSMNKPSSLKTDTKLQKTYEKLHSSKVATQTVAYEMLNRAFLEERRRYCYFVERKCETIQALIEYHETSANILKANLDNWIKVGNSQDDLLPGATALIESSKSRQSTSDGEGVHSRVKNFNSQTLKETSSKRATKASEQANPPERHHANTLSARKIDVYNNPYRNSSCIGGDLGSNDSKEYFSLTEDRLTLPVYASISKSAEMVFTEDAVHFRGKPAPDVARRHASESVETSGWSMRVNRLSTEKKVDEPLKNSGQKEISDNDDGDVFESPKIEGNYSDDQDTGMPTKETLDRDSNETESTEPTERSGTIYEPLYDYIPEAGSNKLELHRGDKIVTCGSGASRGGWIYGENTRTCQKGWFPENYCTLKADEKKVVSATQPTDFRAVKRDGPSRDSRNIFRFSKDLEKTLMNDMKKNKLGRQSWQL